MASTPVASFTRLMPVTKSATGSCPPEAQHFRAIEASQLENHRTCQTSRRGTTSGIDNGGLCLGGRVIGSRPCRRGNRCGVASQGVDRIGNIIDIDAGRGGVERDGQVAVAVVDNTDSCAGIESTRGLNDGYSLGVAGRTNSGVLNRDHVVTEDRGGITNDLSCTPAGAAVMIRVPTEPSEIAWRPASSSDRTVFKQRHDAVQSRTGNVGNRVSRLLRTGYDGVGSTCHKR